MGAELVDWAAAVAVARKLSLPGAAWRHPAAPNKAISIVSIKKSIVRFTRSLLQLSVWCRVARRMPLAAPAGRNGHEPVPCHMSAEAKWGGPTGDM